jgi:S1-C subfamily serine protease
VHLEPHIADFVLYPDPASGETSSPKLMAVLSDNVGKAEITGFPPHSVVEEGGMKRGDVLLAIDSTPIRGADDLKIELSFRKKGDKVTITVFGRTFFGGQEKHFEIVLQ